jgi:hypothetical protein
MVVRALYTVHSIRNVLHYDAIWKMLESYGNYQKVTEHRPELDGMEWKLLEATCIIQVMGLVGPYSYPYHHTQPRDLWCRRQSDVITLRLGMTAYHSRSGGLRRVH